MSNKIKSFERLEKALFNVGLEAALKEKKAKLWANANCKENFSLVIFQTVSYAILDDICLLTDDNDIQWYNDMCKSGTKKYDAFILSICHEAYDKLRKK